MEGARLETVFQILDVPGGQMGPGTAGAPFIQQINHFNGFNGFNIRAGPGVLVQRDQ